MYERGRNISKNVMYVKMDQAIERKITSPVIGKTDSYARYLNILGRLYSLENNNIGECNETLRNNSHFIKGFERGVALKKVLDDDMISNLIIESHNILNECICNEEYLNYIERRGKTR